MDRAHGLQKQGGHPRYPQRHPIGHLQPQHVGIGQRLTGTAPDRLIPAIARRATGRHRLLTPVVQVVIRNLVLSGNLLTERIQRRARPVRETLQRR